MTGNRFNGFSTLGIGVGLRAPHVAHVVTRRPDVAWFEIISENFLVDGGRPLHTLDRIRERYPVVQHGVGLYLGDATGPSRAHLARVKDLVRRTGTPWLTDHLCWGSVDGTFSHDLLPLPYTAEVARHCARSIRIIQDTLEVPFAFENVSSYAAYRESTMTEWQFVTEVAEQADCGILLDVNNVYVSAVNHGFDPLAYLAGIPAERVAQIHVAGHARHDAFIIDTHDHPVADPVWDLYAAAIARCGATPTLLEWDARLPSFAEVHAEAR
ncbi:MAG: DUF692 domain-containing protein, partial [Myxococcales bacterium]|nr:DUF692 domain-containing protein [Myxococcales bacterium]